MLDPQESTRSETMQIGKPSEQSNRLLPLIASFKLAKAFLLFFVAFGFHRLMGPNAQANIAEFARTIRVDPDNHFAHQVIEKVTGVPAHRLREFEVGTFVYGALFATEGTGLLLRFRWAEYLTIVSTLGLLPLEIYELVERPHHKELKALTLTVNILIAVYLIWNVRKAAKSRDRQ